MFKRSKTVVKKKNFSPGTRRYDLHMQAQATLNAGDLRKAVKLPSGGNLGDWLAANTVDFFNQVNLLYSAISSYCTEETCPTMSAGPKYEYHWVDGVDYVKPTPVSAPKYVDLLLQWIQAIVEDESQFPSDFEGKAVTKEFIVLLHRIYKRLFRVYAHIYCSHLDKIRANGLEAHLNTGFKHFYLFVREFRLIEDKKEMEPLKEVIEAACKQYGISP